MSKQFLKFNGATFSYENSFENIFVNISFQITRGWTGIVGPNGSGKTTLLKLACGLLECNSGSIDAPGNCYYNEQRTDYPPLNFSELLKSFDKKAFRLINKLHLKHDWINRWETLSHGERKRVQIACSLFNNPELLAVDEPTNHLDASAKEMVINSLKSYNGIGLIVSHDRDLIEILCEQILFIESPNVDLRLGKLSESLAQKKLENESALKQLEVKKLEINRLEHEYKRRSEVVEKAKRKSSKRNIDKNDRDAKGKIDFGRLTGKDAVGGKQKVQMQKRIENAKSVADNMDVKRSYQAGIKLSDSVSKRNYLLNLDGGSIKLAEGKFLNYKNLVIGTKDKIALTGDNGSGKSTLIKHILKHINAELENTTYIPQEITIEETKSLLSEIKKLPNEQLGRLMIIISRLGSDVKRILATEIPSPGETRKLLLGLGITKNPHIIIMDEPTNHMYIVSTECLEDALKNVSCALLLVSHDQKFLRELTEIEWKISGNGITFELLSN